MQKLKKNIFNINEFWDKEIENSKLPININKEKHKNIRYKNLISFTKQSIKTKNIVGKDLFYLLWYEYSNYVINKEDIFFYLYYHLKDKLNYFIIEKWFLFYLNNLNFLVAGTFIQFIEKNYPHLSTESLKSKFVKDLNEFMDEKFTKKNMKFPYYDTKDQGISKIKFKKFQKLEFKNRLINIKFDRNSISKNIDEEDNDYFLEKTYKNNEKIRFSDIVNKCLVHKIYIDKKYRNEIFGEYFILLKKFIYICIFYNKNNYLLFKESKKINNYLKTKNIKNYKVFWAINLNKIRKSLISEKPNINSSNNNNNNSSKPIVNFFKKNSNLSTKFNSKESHNIDKKENIRDFFNI